MCVCECVCIRKLIRKRLNKLIINKFILTCKFEYMHTICSDMKNVYNNDVITNNVDNNIRKNDHNIVHNIVV